MNIFRNRTTTAPHESLPSICTVNLSNVQKLSGHIGAFDYLDEKSNPATQYFFTVTAKQTNLTYKVKFNVQDAALLKAVRNKINQRAMIECRLSNSETLHLIRIIQ